MKTIDVLHLPNSLWLGRRGENQFRPIAVKWDEWHRDYPDATLSVIYHRPDGQDFIVATGTTSPIIWIPQQDTTTVSGIGELEMHLVGDPEIGISAHVDTIIDDSRSNASVVDAPAWADKVVQDFSEAASHYPQIIDGYWYVWDVESGEWVNTNVRASGGDIDPSDIADAVEDYMEDHPLVETDPTVPAWAKQPTKPTYTAAEVHSLPDTTVIPDAVTEQTVSEWGFTKNTGTYSKPSGGIPKTDLASAVQTSLGKADTALQEHQSLAGYATETWVQDQGYLTQHQDISGKADKIPRIAKASTDTVATIEPNKLYVFPEMASLTITLATPTDNTIVNEYHFMFTSGATATTLTLPASVLQPDGFSVEANHVYEVSIVENCMTAQGWAVTA